MRRRTIFAAPFVLVGCSGKDKQPEMTHNPPQPEIETHNPPMPMTVIDAAVDAPIDGPIDAPVASVDAAAAPAITWSVSQSGKACRAFRNIKCPEPATPGGVRPTCNPPPPIDYACPAGLTPPFKITQVGDECTVDTKKVDCPKR